MTDTHTNLHADIDRGYEQFFRQNRLPHLWCPGCGNGTALKCIAEAIEGADGITQDNTVIVSGIGCSSRGSGYMDFDTVHTAHGRAIPFATGIKLARPELNVIVITGDGDCTAIGGNHFLHGCRRNVDLTVVLFNNNIYGMTGGQTSPTTACRHKLPPKKTTARSPPLTAPGKTKKSALTGWTSLMTAKPRRSSPPPPANPRRLPPPCGTPLKKTRYTMNILEHIAHTIGLFLFGIYPYIALAVCILGCILRYDREPYTWKAGSSQIMSKKSTRLANNLFHFGVLGIIGGHCVGLLTPHWLYEPFISSAHKQLLAMVAGGIAGLAVIAGRAMMIHRRFTVARVEKTSSFADKAILILLFAQVSLGLISIIVSAGHLDGHTMVKLGEYFQSGVVFNTFAGYEGIRDVNIIYKLHILLGFTLILLTPFTRLVHAISAPI